VTLTTQLTSGTIESERPVRDLDLAMEVGSGDKLGHLTNPSDAVDSENQRRATQGERECYQFVGEDRVYDAGYKDRPARGPMLGVDLVHYMRTGVVRRHPRAGPAVSGPAPFPKALRYHVVSVPDVDRRGEPAGFRVIAVPE